MTELVGCTRKKLNSNRVRIIPRLDIKGDRLIKGVQLEGLRVIGDPAAFAERYYNDGADELIYKDVVASLYGRNNITDMVAKTAEHIFIPLTVGGGIRSVDDVEILLRNGADKICLNSAAIKRPQLISEIASKFGSQCCVVEIEAKLYSSNTWLALYENGRENSEREVVKWACEAAELGAGELLITSVDRDGTRAGMDEELLSSISRSVTVPIIASGGIGTISHLCEIASKNITDAIAIADLLHFGRETIQNIKIQTLRNGINVRP